MNNLGVIPKRNFIVCYGKSNVFKDDIPENQGAKCRYYDRNVLSKLTQPGPSLPE